MTTAQANGILFVINRLETGGAEHVLLDLVRELQRRGRYRPVIACLKDRGPLAAPLEEAGIAVHEKLLADRYDYHAAPRLMRIIRGEGIRALTAVGSGGDRMFWGTIAARAAGVPVAVWAHIYSQPGHLNFESVNRLLYPLVRRFVALGRRHKRSMASLDKVPLGKIAVINNGVDVERFDHPEWRDRARSILGLADENVTAIAMIANLRADKRHDIFIAAARQIVRHRRDVHFFVIGDGPNRAAVHQWARQSGLLGQYLSVLGQREDVSQLLPGLDLVCLTSEYHECLSLSVLQAMAAGVPAVSYFIGSMDEAIVNNQTGFFFYQLSAAALRQRLLEVIGDGDLRREVAGHARDLVRRRFTVEKMTDDFTALFDSLPAPRGASIWRR
ncbi:MAG: glycosyltransferase [Phycisphaerae bacterium]|nr:glycosyltransferase [Phycisphaerae bacterium]